MSYSGQIAISAPAAGAVIGGLLAAGAVAVVAYGVGRGVYAVGSAVADAVEQERLNKLSGELGDALAEAESIDRQMASALAAAQGKCLSEHERTLEKISEMMAQTGDSDKFIKECSKAGSELDRRMDEVHLEIEQMYRGRIESAVDKTLAQVRMKRKEIQASLEAIEDYEQKMAVAASAARQKIDQTKQTLLELKGRFSGRMCTEAIRIVNEQLLNAERNLSEGLSEGALIDAYSAEDAVYMRVKEMITAESTMRQRYINVKGALEALINAYDKAKSADFESERTASGSKIEKHIDDMSVYYRGEYERIGDQIAQLSARLSADYMDISVSEIEDIRREINTLRDHFVQESITANERVNSESMRKETAKVLVKRYKEKGYSLIPLDESDKEYSPLDRITVRMQNDTTGERVYLMLDAVKDENGHIAMNVEIEDHTDYEGSLDEIEAAREQERLENCAALKGTKVGEGMRMKQRCKNPGVPDTYRGGH